MAPVGSLLSRPTLFGSSLFTLSAFVVCFDPLQSQKNYKIQGLKSTCPLKVLEQWRCESSQASLLKSKEIHTLPSCDQPTPRKVREASQVHTVPSSCKHVGQLSQDRPRSPETRELPCWVPNLRELAVMCGHQVESGLWFVTQQQIIDRKYISHMASKQSAQRWCDFFQMTK